MSTAMGGNEAVVCTPFKKVYIYKDDMRSDCQQSEGSDCQQSERSEVDLRLLEEEEVNFTKIWNYVAPIACCHVQTQLP